LHTQILKVKIIIVPNPEPMDDQLAYLIASLGQKLDEAISEKIKHERIPIEQVRVLNALAQSDGEAMGSLASRALVDPTTLTKMIDRMVTEALVYRAPAPDDRRKVLIFLAPSGRALFIRLSGVLDEQQRSLVQKLNEPKAKELKRLLLELMHE
jgi:DNA-binding MarR family transcriptional regulator